MENIRLQKYLAEAGIASRRTAELFILQGLVKVNGEVVTELGTKVGQDDYVEFKGREVAKPEPKVYIIFNKPVGVLCTVRKGKEKEYLVDVNSDITKEFLIKMRTGVLLEEGKTTPAVVQQLDKRKFKIILKQGMNRQIRRMCEELGYRVKKLHRVRINKLELGNLGFGCWKFLKNIDLEKLI